MAGSHQGLYGPYLHETGRATYSVVQNRGLGFAQGLNILLTYLTDFKLNIDMTQN